jgi:ParB family chromosome partitioning protein
MAQFILPIDQIQPNPFQPREKIKNSEELQELVSSIKNYGVLEPIVVAHTPAGYQLIAGERRWQAAKIAGLTEIPVVLKETSPRGMLEMALVENIQRVDLSPIERALGFRQLIRDHQFTAKSLSEKIGKSQAYISNSLKLLDLPDAIKDGLVGGQITEGHARALMAISDEKAMVDCYKIILKEAASVRRAEELARRFRDSSSLERGEVRQAEQVPEHLIRAWSDQVQQQFHAKAKLDFSRSLRQTRVTIILKGSPEETQEDLEKMMKLVTSTKHLD